jgi:hypothetical protein
MNMRAGRSPDCEISEIQGTNFSCAEMIYQRFQLRPAGSTEPDSIKELFFRKFSFSFVLPKSRDHNALPVLKYRTSGDFSHLQSPTHSHGLRVYSIFPKPKRRTPDDFSHFVFPAYSFEFRHYSVLSSLKMFSYGYFSQCVFELIALPRLLIVPS